MPAAMSKRERLRATLEGRPVDRPAYSFWRHFYERETSAEGLAESMLDFLRRYDLDFLKVNSRAQYHAEAWGTKFHYSGDPLIKPEFASSPIQSASDWRKIRRLPPDHGALGEILRALRLIRRGIADDTIFIQTVFNPLSVAAYIVGSTDVMLGHLRERPDDVESALAAIAETFRGFARACLETGCGGLFYATTTVGTYDAMTDDEWARFGRPYDLGILEVVHGAEFSVLHVCKEHNMLRALQDYPVQALSWAATTPTNPSLAEMAREAPDKALIAGVSQEALTAPTPDQAIAEVRKARAEGGPRWICGPNCSIPVDSRDENIRAVIAELTQ